jgi:hypothetical protein
VIDTNARTMDATTSRSRRTNLSLCQAQYRHNRCQAALSPPEAPGKQWVAVAQC